MKLQSMRKSKGMTQKELAEKSGVPQRTIEHYENQIRRINGAKIEVLVNLAEALDCKIYDIMENKELINKLKRRV